MVRIRRRSKPETKMVRVRIKDLQRLKAMANSSQKKIKLPDLVSEIIRMYPKRRKI